jgi:hypothetical protein
MPKIYRTQTEIIARIPHLVNDENCTIETQTQIMHKSFLSYAQLKELPCPFDTKWTFRISGWNKKVTELLKKA